MLGRRSDVYSSLARFVSSIACKRQTSPHPNVEKEKDETKREEEKRREERWYLLHTYISRSMAEEKKEMGWRVCKDMRGKCWERGSPLLSCSHSRALAIDVMTCYSSRQSRIHTCTSSDTHSHNIHSMQRPPRRTTVQITPITFEPCPTISPLDRYSR